MHTQRAITTKPLQPNERQEALAAFKWGWFERSGYSPHTGQIPIHLSDARFRSAIAGTRGGKSRCSGEEATALSLIGPTRTWLVGQTYDTTEKEFRYIWDAYHSEAFYEVFGDVNDVLTRAVYSPSSGNMQIMTEWGSEVTCISLERAGTSAFGEEVDLLIFCEPAQIKRPKELYERILHGRLASRMGGVLNSGTPAGKAPPNDPDGWLLNFTEKGILGHENYDPMYFTNIWPSWENPDFKDDPYWIRSWMNPLIFAEQYEGQFIVISGAIFKSFDPLTHVIKPFTVPKNWNRWEAIDPGYSGMFYWAAGVTGYDGCLYITDEYYDTETKYIDRANVIWQKRLAAYSLAFRPFRNPQENRNLNTWRNAQSNGQAPSLCNLYIDPEDPQFIAEMRDYGLMGLTADNNVHIGINAVEQRLAKPHPTLYFSSENPVAIEAMQYHSWGDKRGSDIRKPANDKYKHPADVIRYLCMSNLTPSVERVEEVKFADGEEDIFALLEKTSSLNGVRQRYEKDPYYRRVSV